MEPPARKSTRAPLPPSRTRVALSGQDLASLRLATRKVYTLPLEKLRPSIRIAHRGAGALEIAERIILDHELVLVLVGKGTLRIGEGALPFAAGDLLFIPPFTPNVFDSPRSSGGEHLAVHFDLAAQFPPLAANLPRRLPYEVRFAHGLVLPGHTPTNAMDPIRSWLHHIVALFSLGEPLARLRAEALLLNILAGLFERTRSPGGGAGPDTAISHALRSRIERALNHLEGHLAEHLTPADLANAAGLSVSHFTRLFRRWAALSPGEYVLRRRVEEARKLLGDVRLSIKEVAARCGFEDPYYFSKVFRRIDGLPPTHFREARLAGQNPGGMSVDSIG